MLENGKLLGEGHDQHANIFALGRGRYSLCKGGLYFSMSDNGDPNANARKHEIACVKEFGVGELGLAAVQGGGSVTTPRHRATDQSEAGVTLQHPVVSIVLPFLNGEKFIEEAIESVIAQSLSRWELLLVNDGSTDRSTSAALWYAEKHHDRVRYFEHPGAVNLGQGPSRNLGIARARGQYVAFLDADDVWLPAKLEKQVAVLESHPEVAMTYGPYFIWHGWTGRAEDEARDARVEIGEETIYDRVLPPPGILLSYIKTGGGLPAPCSVLLRRSILEQLGDSRPSSPACTTTRHSSSRSC